MTLRQGLVWSSHRRNISHVLLMHSTYGRSTANIGMRSRLSACSSTCSSSEWYRLRAFRRASSANSLAAACSPLHAQSTPGHLTGNALGEAYRSAPSHQRLAGPLAAMLPLRSPQLSPAEAPDFPNVNPNRECSPLRPPYI